MNDIAGIVNDIMNVTIGYELNNKNIFMPEFKYTYISGGIQICILEYIRLKFDICKCVDIQNPLLGVIYFSIK